MSLEKLVLSLTSMTPSGGTCRIGDLPFTVWFGSDYWEWEFQGVYYFDPLDLAEAIEACLKRALVGAARISWSEKIRPGLKLVRRKYRTLAARVATGVAPSRLAPGSSISTSPPR